MYNVVAVISAQQRSAVIYCFCARSTATTRAVATQLMCSISRQQTSMFISAHRENRICAQISELCVRSESLTALSIKIGVRWDVIQFSLTDGYQPFRETF